ncbi:MAG: hypothetical protein L6W00_06135 [Lentisphaeria bacterium]|nr:MAG: hypothetical protein L6W00_06135 [Lentisphaeria bacterium]
MSLSGFVPEPEIEKLRAAAREHGWGLLITDPAPGGCGSDTAPGIEIQPGDLAALPVSRHFSGI